MIDTLKMFILWSLGIWAGYVLYRDFKTKPKVRKFIYWFSIVAVSFLLIPFPELGQGHRT